VALEREAREQAEEEKARGEAQLKERVQKKEALGRKLGRRPPQAPDPEQAKPAPKARRNFTDSDSRGMKDGATKEFVQAYDAQAVVDSHAQVIVVASVKLEANDKKQLVPMLEEVKVPTGSPPWQATADAGYFSE
jgi:sRNA-binding protein